MVFLWPLPAMRKGAGIVAWLAGGPKEVDLPNVNLRRHHRALIHLLHPDDEDVV